MGKCFIQNQLMIKLKGKLRHKFWKMKVDKIKDIEIQKF